ncbi:sel1 repeat family protein, partial [Methylobacterium oxalidis]
PVAALAAPAPNPKLDALVARGEQLLTAGEVAAARLFFQRVASEGDARGARGMARSYDQAVLRTLPVVGLEGSRAEAERWYLKAAELEAQRR